MKRRHFLGTLAASATFARGADETAPPLLRFGLIADAQYADADAEGKPQFPVIQVVAENLDCPQHDCILFTSMPPTICLVQP